MAKACKDHLLFIHGSLMLLFLFTEQTSHDRDVYDMIGKISLQMMDLSVNIPLEEALDLGWDILAECFEPNETGLKTSLIKERWPNKAALN